MTVKRARAFRYGPQLSAYGFLVALAVMLGCGGNAGVDNGTVVGRVFSNASGISQSRTPLANVTVVLRRTAGTLAVIRRGLSDANGQFVFGEVPVGPYTLGYSRQGFIPIDPNQGSSTTVTNLVARDIFVEPASTTIVPDVTLDTNFQTGSSTVVITVLDSITGDPITAGTVSAGVVVTSNGGNNGVYTLNVPIQPGDTSDFTSPLGAGAGIFTVQADGFQTFTGNIGLVANETIRQTVFLIPTTVRIEGLVRVARFEALFDLLQVAIKITNAAVTVTGPDLRGFFTISNVPSSNSQFTRTFNIRFTHHNLQTFVLSNFVAPRSGERSVPLVVTMTPITVDVVGSVIDASGNLPNSGLGLDTATILETGQSTNIVNGAYTIPAVPVRNRLTDTSFTIRLRAFNPTAINPNPPPATGRIEGADLANVRPLSDGSPNAVFIVPLIKTNPL